MRRVPVARRGQRHQVHVLRRQRVSTADVEKVLRENAAMLGLAECLGFRREPVRVPLELRLGADFDVVR